jgi:hypothetical protein
MAVAAHAAPGTQRERHARQGETPRPARSAKRRVPGAV